ncbi:MAG: hypothetical protein Q4B29_01520 [Candidatus Saccharibacteria bacterium]|nr:hypothetical protein [Candidatus Saccharibacteria bacterium]
MATTKKAAAPKKKVAAKTTTSKKVATKTVASKKATQVKDNKNRVVIFTIVACVLAVVAMVMICVSAMVMKGADKKFACELEGETLMTITYNNEKVTAFEASEDGVFAETTVEEVNEGLEAYGGTVEDYLTTVGTYLTSQGATCTLDGEELEVDDGILEIDEAEVNYED